MLAAGRKEMLIQYGMLLSSAFVIIGLIFVILDPYLEIWIIIAARIDNKVYARFCTYFLKTVLNEAGLSLHDSWMAVAISPQGVDDIELQFLTVDFCFVILVISFASHHCLSLCVFE